MVVVVDPSCSFRLPLWVSFYSLDLGRKGNVALWINSAKYIPPRWAPKCEDETLGSALCGVVDAQSGPVSWAITTRSIVSVSVVRVKGDFQSIFPKELCFC